MKLRLPILASAFALVALMAITPTAFAASSSSVAARSSLSVPVTGSIASPPGGSFTGTLTNLVIKDVNGVLMTTGTLNGTLTTAAGNTINVVNQLVSFATTATGSCTILTLTLGPLDLNLLGLMVHLNQVNLTITAQQGPGNLLGNLLCAVANLLNNNGGLNGLVTSLNNLLTSLGL